MMRSVTHVEILIRREETNVCSTYTGSIVGTDLAIDFSYKFTVPLKQTDSGGIFCKMFKIGDKLDVQVLDFQFKEQHIYTFSREGQVFPEPFASRINAAFYGPILLALSLLGDKPEGKFTVPVLTTETNHLFPDRKTMQDYLRSINQ